MFFLTDQEAHDAPYFFLAINTDRAPVMRAIHAVLGEWRPTREQGAQAVRLLSKPTTTTPTPTASTSPRPGEPGPRTPTLPTG